MPHKVPRNDYRFNADPGVGGEKYLHTFCNKKSCRTVANRKVRRYRGGIASGGNYKRIGEVMWEVC